MNITIGVDDILQIKHSIVELANITHARIKEEGAYKKVRINPFSEPDKKAIDRAVRITKVCLKILEDSKLLDECSSYPGVKKARAFAGQIIISVTSPNCTLSELFSKIVQFRIHVNLLLLRYK